MIIKEINESISAQYVDGFGEVKFDREKLNHVMGNILYQWCTHSAWRPPSHYQ